MRVEGREVPLFDIAEPPGARSRLLQVGAACSCDDDLQASFAKPGRHPVEQLEVLARARGSEGQHVWRVERGGARPGRGREVAGCRRRHDADAIRFDAEQLLEFPRDKLGWHQHQLRACRDSA